MKKLISQALLTIMAFAVTATAAAAQAVDPAGSSPISGALDWIQGTLMGKVATTVAVIAVAAVGFMMLTGRMNWRYGATVIVGVFILFGAATIVSGIQAVAN
ncbi:trbC/VIRB2 family protein [Asticcacaulis biprosthecium C19]|uniref:TrbC/VIRB2 family protein n=1 Tax=Asticcacaulis biprosthecium C19 TaxID=715226 RepID=F4QNF8_9CAUL|nr:TrbC/VirB2 family protein [Asticcacaulis biprosthecium]EGF90866.1 trbC/VIRB2 family protein [Asticcacaulis biprosthecium C19]